MMVMDAAISRREYTISWNDVELIWRYIINSSNIIFMWHLHRLKHSLTTWGEKFSADEVSIIFGIEIINLIRYDNSQCESMMAEAPMKGQRIDIKKWAKVITGASEEVD